MSQQTNPVLSEECPHGAYESEHEDGACPCFPGVVVNPVPSKAALDALVTLLNAGIAATYDGAGRRYDTMRDAAAAITALRKREVTDAMCERICRMIDPNFFRVTIYTKKALMRRARQYLEAALAAQAEAEKP